MSNYGAPYKGSKSKIADKLIAALPEADTFCDLFAGGCAMTHAAMVSGKYKHFIANDLDGMGVQLFTDAVAGKYHDENRWVSRDMFFLLKDSDPYVRYCWSFGNDGRTYMYGREIEPYKKALHEMLFAKTVNERRLKWMALYKMTHDLKDDSGHGSELESLESLQRLESLEILQRLESLESLQRLERLQSLETSALDYQAVKIPDDAVIYCDIPYKNRNDYSKENDKNIFNYDRFYEWALKQENIFISEYQMPEEFECVLEIEHRSILAAGKNDAVTERLFIPRGQREENKMTLFDLFGYAT